MDRLNNNVETLSIRVRYSHCDRMGVVYHVNYLEYFEWARSDWIRNFWKSYDEVEKEGYYFIVIESHLRFHAPAHYEELLNVQVNPVDWGRSKVEIEYRIVRENDEKLICSGKTIHCFTDRNGKPVAIPIELRNLLTSNH